MFASEFTVNITKFPSDILFMHLNNNQILGIGHVPLNSQSTNLGLVTGDVLIAINGQSVSNNISSHHSLQILKSQPPPFTATFMRYQQLSKSVHSFPTKQPATTRQNTYTNNFQNEEWTQYPYPISTNNEEITENITSPTSPEEYNAYTTYDTDTYNNIQRYEEQRDDRNEEKSHHLRVEPISSPIPDNIHFDYQTQNRLTNKICMISTNGLQHGIHEWSIKIIKCNALRQEIGIISNSDIDNIKIQKGGIKNTIGFGARAIYGNKVITGFTAKPIHYNYYASYNDNKSIRCFKNLSGKDKQGWNDGDIIKICLNLKYGNIKFYLNGQKVRKTMSVQMNKVYFPVIAFSGHCEYQLV